MKELNQGNAGRGRKRGVPNRLTAELRGVVLSALHNAGGVDYLVKVARENPAVFCALLGRLLPLEARLEALAVVDATPGLSINIDLGDVPQVRHVDSVGRPLS